MLTFLYIIAAFDLLIGIAFSVMACGAKEDGTSKTCWAIAIFSLVNMLAVMWR